MPYGLACVPSVFQCLISDIFRDFLGKFIIAYIDDILIHSPSRESHVSTYDRSLLNSWTINCMSRGRSVNFTPRCPWTPRVFQGFHSHTCNPPPILQLSKAHSPARVCLPSKSWSCYSTMNSSTKASMRTLSVTKGPNSHTE